LLEYLEQVVISMETLLDLDKMSIEVAVDHLQASTGKEVASQLLLTEEQWNTRFKAALGEKFGGSSSGGGGAGHDCGRGRGGGHDGGA
jgi:hypothetical protein